MFFLEQKYQVHISRFLNCEDYILVVYTKISIWLLLIFSEGYEIQLNLFIQPKFITFIYQNQRNPPKMCGNLVVSKPVPILTSYWVFVLQGITKFDSSRTCNFVAYVVAFYRFWLKIMKFTQVLVWSVTTCILKIQLLLTKLCRNFVVSKPLNFHCNLLS